MLVAGAVVADQPAGQRRRARRRGRRARRRPLPRARARRARSARRRRCAARAARPRRRRALTLGRARRARARGAAAPRSSLGAQRLELVDGDAREQRAVDLEARVLGRRADQRDEALLDGRQQRVLLGLVEAVDLVEEEDRRAAAVACALDHRADLGAARVDGAVLLELGAAGAGDDPRQRRLARPRRAVQDHRVQPAALERARQRRPRRRAARGWPTSSSSVARAHPHRERRRRRRPRGAPRTGGPCASVSRLESGRRGGTSLGCSAVGDPDPGGVGRAAAAADPLRHRQPARQRARRAGVPRGRPDRGRLRLRAARRARRSARTWWRAWTGRRPGPVLCLLSHVDTVLATPSEWSHDPWSGDLADGFVWGRGALDMKSQTAAEVAAACALARGGWRPARRLAARRRARRRGDRRLRGRAVADRDPPREGPLRLPRQRGRRRHHRLRRAPPVLPRLRREGDLPLRPAHRRRRRRTPRCRGSATTRCSSSRRSSSASPARQPSYRLTAEPRAFLEAIGVLDGDDAAGALARVAAVEPRLVALIEPMARRVARADADLRLGEDQRDPVARAARRRLPRAARPRRGGGASPRSQEVVGPPGPYRLEWTEQVMGNRSPIDSPMTDFIRGWIAERDPAALCVPTVLPGFTDSRTFRDAFPRVRRLRLLPAPPRTKFETDPADPRRRRAHRRARPRVRDRLLRRSRRAACSAPRAERQPERSVKTAFATPATGISSPTPSGGFITPGRRPWGADKLAACRSRASGPTSRTGRSTRCRSSRSSSSWRWSRCWRWSSSRCRGPSRRRSSPTPPAPSAGRTSPASRTPAPSCRRSSSSSRDPQRFERARRTRAARRAPARAARDRQDAAREGRRARVGRALLRAVGRRLRRDVRRPRRRAHPPAVPHRPQERARDHLHRRARRRRRPARHRASTASRTRRSTSCWSRWTASARATGWS